MATTPDRAGSASGEGDDVVLFLSEATKARITNRGEANFVVQVIPIDSGYADLPVNEIGSYEGTVAFDAPAVVQVRSSGTWAIDPS